MARPKHDNPLMFTRSELIEASGLAQGNVKGLRDREIGPFAKRDQAGGTYGEDTLAELAMIGAVAGAGYQLVLGAALVNAFLDQHPNHPPALFCGIARFDKRIPFRGDSWFHRYVILRRDRAVQGLTETHDDDMLLLVADNTYVLWGARGGFRLGFAVPAPLDGRGPQPIGWLQDFKRGGEATLTTIPDRINPLFIPDPADPSELVEAPEAVAAQTEIQDAARNASALVAVNLSLAIRRAFDRVYLMRKARGGPLWPEGAT